MIAAVVVGLAVARGPDVSNRDHPEFDAVWHTEIQNLDPDVPGSPTLTAIDSADRGGNRREMITTGSAWVLVAEQDEVRALIALDPTDGSQVWRKDLPEVLCSHRTGPQDTLFCLAADTAGGQDWTGYIFDAATGAELESWQAPITGAWAVSLTDAGLAVLAESQPHTYDHLSLLDSQDGTEIWSADLSVIDDEFLFRTHDIDDVEQTYLPSIGWSGAGERIMLSSGTTLILIEGGSGEFLVQDCYPTVNTGETLGCSTFRESTMYDASGEHLWTSDRVELARPSYRGEHVLVNVADQSVHHTDWDSGYIGAAVQSVGYSPIAAGSGAHPFLIDEHDLLSLAPDGSQVHWTQRVRGMNSITDVWVVNDVAIVAGDSALALDLATGEELWQRSYTGNMYLVDFDPVVIGYREVSLLQVP